MHELHDKKLISLVVHRFHIVLLPKDAAVLLLKSLKHSVWNKLVPHPVIGRDGKRDNDVMWHAREGN